MKMVLLFSLALFMFIVAFVFFLTLFFDTMEKGGKIHVSIISMVSCLIGAILLYGCVKAPSSYIETDRYDILACQDSLGVRGSGSRYYVRINSEQQIILAIGSKSNYVIWTLPASDCQFYITEGQPHVVKAEQCYYEGTILESKSGYIRYNIYIPEDTLITDYTIDLQ